MATKPARFYNVATASAFHRAVDTCESPERAIAAECDVHENDLVLITEFKGERDGSQAWVFALGTEDGEKFMVWEVT